MMPVSTEEKYRAVLKKHEEMENPPTFLFECLNGRQQREVLLFKESMGKQKTGTLANFDEVFGLVESHLVGWENIGVEYTKGGLSDIINYMQCLELLALIAYQPPSIADKKKSKSPSPLSTENSAKDAPGATSVDESSPSTPAGDSTE